MGRLAFSKLIKSLKTRKFFARGLSWAPSFVLPVVLLLGIHTAAFANQPPSTNELNSYINSGGHLRVGSVVQNDYQQAYYEYNGNYFYITDEPYNHVNVVSQGRFMVWERVVQGRSQIVLYDAVTRADHTVASSGANARPAVDEFGNVVWQRWDGAFWQVYHFDYVNNSVTPVTREAYSSIRPDVQGGDVAYTRKDASSWRTYRYSVANQQREEVITGTALDAAWPQFKSDSSLSTSKQAYTTVIEPL